MQNSLKNGATYAAAIQYTEADDTRAPPVSSSNPSTAAQSNPSNLPPRHRVAQVASLNGYNASPDLPPPLYVRALYDYAADDHTSLSFRQGDIIQVLTQLESGWWDGVINDVRGWFPSNYCTVISGPDDPGDLTNGHESETSAESGTEDEDLDEDEDSDSHTQDDDSHLPIEGAEGQNQEEAAFWIPQATPDGRLFYFNTLTGVSTMELPLETPTAANETGPRDRTNFHVPEQTRAPAEMMAGGFQQEEDYDGSASEADGEHSISVSQSSLTRGHGSSSFDTVSTSTSMNSTSTEPARHNIREHYPTTSMSSQANITFAPIGTTATSFSVAPQGGMQQSSAPKYFLDDGAAARTTWASLVGNMRASIDAYRQSIKNHERAEFVRRAEDISDHLRLLLAAGSGTTDNHSGNPSIISTNKALYPHFREMMSKFSKLVLSSHIAAADWPGPEAYAKCLQEADGVMNGVYGYVEVARHQRGEEIPRLLPGFVLGSSTGGNWQDNNIDSKYGAKETSFLRQNDADLKPRPSAVLDTQLLGRIEEARKSLVANLRRLEDQLQLSEKIVTPARQAAIGDSICLAAGAVIENFRPWVNQVESIDLGPLGNVFQNPSLVDFASQKQKVYDSLGELVLTCQAVTAPLSDEWAEVRGESLDTRLSNVRGSCKQLESHVAQIGYSLKLLQPATGLGAPANTNKKDHRMTDGGETYQNNVLRAEPSHAINHRPHLAEVGPSKSYTLGQDVSPERFRRPPVKDKARQFFGQVPPTLANLRAANPEPGFVPEEQPRYLQLDHLGEITYDNKTDPPQVKSGTLAGLVEQLTRHDRPDTQFNSTFLLTYQSFTTAQELFEMLVKRFNIQPPPGLTREEYDTWEAQKLKLVRFRVVNVLKTWFEQFWVEDVSAESQALLERAQAFAKNTINSTKIPGAGPLSTVIDQRMKGQDTSAKRLVLTLTKDAPAPILPKNMKKLKFLDIDVTEFARQLTIIESKMYSKIKPDECLGLKWMRKDRSENEPAPHVRAMILHANQLTNWVAEMILANGEVKKRVNVIKQFVQIADVSGIVSESCSLLIHNYRDAVSSTISPVSSPLSQLWALPPFYVLAGLGYQCIRK